MPCLHEYITDDFFRQLLIGSHLEGNGKHAPDGGIVKYAQRCLIAPLDFFQQGVEFILILRHVCFSTKTTP
jgi:hypothetical protein